MKRKKLIPIISLLVIGVLFLLGCSGDMLTAPGEDNENQLTNAQQQGVPFDQLKLISWKPEVVSQFRVLSKRARRPYEQKKIQAHRGGTVGGKVTYKNKVEIPPDALSENTWISVEVLCVDKDGQCSPIVEFLPSINFLLDVTLTLSYDVLEFSGDPNLLKVYWYDTSTGLWVEVEDPVLNEKNKTVSVQVDHFTQYSWAL